MNSLKKDIKKAIRENTKYIPLKVEKPELNKYTMVMTIEVTVMVGKKILRSSLSINKIIDEVNMKFGAPMGRPNIGHHPGDKKHVYDCAVPMASGGYDRGGAYWGLGKQLRVRYTKDLSYIEFYRREN